MQQWPHQSEIAKFYGNPQGRAGRASAVWEAANLVKVVAPWRMVTAWKTPDGTHARVSSVRVHRLCAESLSRVFAAIWEASGRSQAQIEAWGCHLFGGAYNFRLMRGGTRLSMHSYGCAIDLDPERNAMGNRNPNFGSIRVVRQAFDDEGWEWGGDWSSPDGMHWQAART